MAKTGLKQYTGMSYSIQYLSCDHVFIMAINSINFKQIIYYLLVK